MFRFPFLKKTQIPDSTGRKHPRAFADSHWPPIIYTSVYVLLATLLLPSGQIPAKPLSWIASLALASLSAACFWINAEIIRPEKPHKATRLCLLYTTVVLSLLVGTACESFVTFIAESTSPGSTLTAILLLSLPLLMPHFLAPTLLTLLLGPAFATIVGVGLSMLLTVQLLLLDLTNSQGSFAAVGSLAAGSLLTGLVSAVVVPMTIRVRRVHTARQLFHSTPIVMSAAAAGLIAWGMLTDGSPAFHGAQWILVIPCMAVFALLGCALQFAIVLVLLPQLERFFAITSDISLQTYADPNFPLLERLQQEAPGTMDHCRQVSVCAANAAKEIGANDFLVRVAALYHDIGKLQNPGMFIENKKNIPGGNPHDTLSPQTSASHIINHVQNGHEIARRHRLPPILQDLILQHHGTTLVTFFHNKAIEAAKAANLPPPDESRFRYPGPKPSTKEAGILMLADSVEASARALSSPDEQSLRDCVSKRIEEKLKDGQLDNCPLTMADLGVLRDSLLSSLLAQYHGRISYQVSPSQTPELAVSPAPGATPAPAPKPAPVVKPMPVATPVSDAKPAPAAKPAPVVRPMPVVKPAPDAKAVP